MTHDQKQEYLEFAKKLAYEAGDIARRYYKEGAESRYKNTINEGVEIVTIADVAINSMFIERVKKAFPDHGVFGEEESYNDESSEYVWVCDPIDGTVPFVMGLMDSVFSLALTHLGTSVVGVVYDFHGDKLYEAATGCGAFMNGTKIRVNDLGLNHKARLNYDWWPQAEYDIAPIIYAIARETKIYALTIGSQTHAGVFVAKGNFVASVFAGTVNKNVDIAAVKVIVEEAGGKVTDLYGHEQRYDRPINGAIVSNGIVHDEIIDYMKILKKETRNEI